MAVDLASLWHDAAPVSTANSTCKGTPRHERQRARAHGRAADLQFDVIGSTGSSESGGNVTRRFFRRSREQRVWSAAKPTEVREIVQLMESGVNRTPWGRGIEARQGQLDGGAQCELRRPARAVGRCARPITTEIAAVPAGRLRRGSPSHRRCSERAVKRMSG